MGMRETSIRPILNGWIVKVGCQEVAFTNAAELCHRLGLYLAEPDREEAWWLESAVNKRDPGLPVNANRYNPVSNLVFSGPITR